MTNKDRIEKSIPHRRSTDESVSKKQRRNPREKAGKTEIDSKGGSAGLEEIDSMFLQKKRTKSEIKEAEIKEEISKKKRLSESKSTRHKGNGSIPSRAGETRTNWADDGLGGKYNAEGYTGRIQDGCKVFKAHILNKPNFGNSKDCPFDCDCCFI
jgi:hypothetical protein